MFITKAKHDAIVAAKDAEIARTADRARRYAESLRFEHSVNTALSARLDRFTANRARDEKGRYLPDVRS